VVGNVYNQFLIQQATDNLNGTLDTLLAAGVLPVYPRPVRTLESAKRRLGIDADQWITQYAICPKCWKHHTPKEMDELPSALCTVPNCDGIIFDEYQDGKGRKKRKLHKINPQTSIIQTLRRFFMRPGFAQSIRDSRNNAPDRNEDKDFVMEDMHDAQGWHDLYTNTIREVGDHGTIRDTLADDAPIPTKLTSHRFGLHLTINTDWYVYCLSRFLMIYICF